MLLVYKYGYFCKQNTERSIQKFQPEKLHQMKHSEVDLDRSSGVEGWRGSDEKLLETSPFTKPQENGSDFSLKGLELQFLP